MAKKPRSSRGAASRSAPKTRARKESRPREASWTELWSMMNRVRKASGGELGAACAAFRAELAVLDDDRLLTVVAQFDAAMARAYDWPMWAAAYLIHGGCSDDRFWDFRAGLVALGRDVYERAVRDPDSLAAIEDIEERTLFEGFQYLPGKVLEERGLPDPGGLRHGHSRKPTGTKWTEDLLPALCPRLAARFDADE